MRTPQTKGGNSDTVRTSTRPTSHERLSSSVTALVIEQVLAKLGVHARLSDIVRGAQLIETRNHAVAFAPHNRSICAE